MRAATPDLPFPLPTVPARPLRTLFLDFNAFFASVEQMLQPKLRGRPIGIAPVLTDSSCCIAASYEAKAFGVKTGTGVSEARRLCPDITIVLARPKEYVRVHNQALKATDLVMPVHRVLSVDEYACHLDALQRTRPAAESIAHALKRILAEKISPHLKCSIGIAPTRLLAKMASDMQKPNGLTIIESHQIPAVLSRMELQDVPGIADGMERRLHAAGVRTLIQFIDMPERDACKAWGSLCGGQFRNWLRGDPSGEDQRTIRRCVGHSHVLSPEMREEPRTREVAVRLLVRAAARMREEGYVARRLAITLTLMGTHRVSPDSRPPLADWSASCDFPDCDDTTSLVEAFCRLYERRPPSRVFQAGVTLLELVPVAHANVPMFEEARRRANLSRSLDKINGRYGNLAIHPLSMLNGRESAPVRIPFGKVPTMQAFE